MRVNMNKIESKNKLLARASLAGLSLLILAGISAGCISSPVVKLESSISENLDSSSLCEYVGKRIEFVSKAKIDSYSDLRSTWIGRLDGAGIVAWDLYPNSDSDSVLNALSAYQNVSNINNQADLDVLLQKYPGELTVKVEGNVTRYDNDYCYINSALIEILPKN